METKVCTYSESNVRLQLVRVDQGLYRTFEIRFNRRLIRTFQREEAQLSRLVFCHYVSMICVDRITAGLSKLT